MTFAPRSLRSIYAFRRGAAGLLLLCLASASHAACVRLNPAQDVVDHAASLPNVDFPGMYYDMGSYRGRLNDAYECSAGQDAFIIDVAFPGLRYEGELDAEGDTYAVYSFSDRSPLVGFAHAATDAAVGVRQPLRLGQINRNPGHPLTVPGPLHTGLQVFVWLRGGAMESVPRTLVGTATSWPENDPSQRLQHTITVQFNIRPLTCALTDTSHRLADVTANDLVSPGDWANESAFDVVMNCPSANVDVALTLSDADGSNSADGTLAPSAGSTARGVQVQLLHGGRPVQLGQAWRHGYSSKGAQLIPFSARYLRNSDALEPGDINGQAVLTADYR